MSLQAHVGREQVGERRPWATPRCVNVEFLGVLQVWGIQAAGASPDLGPAALGVQQQVLQPCGRGEGTGHWGSVLSCRRQLSDRRPWNRIWW